MSNLKKENQRLIKELEQYRQREVDLNKKIKEYSSLLKNSNERNSSLVNGMNTYKNNFGIIKNKKDFSVAQLADDVAQSYNKDQLLTTTVEVIINSKKFIFEGILIRKSNNDYEGACNIYLIDENGKKNLRTVEPNCVESNKFELLETGSIDIVKNIVDSEISDVVFIKEGV